MNRTCLVAVLLLGACGSNDRAQTDTATDATPLSTEAASAAEAEAPSPTPSPLEIAGVQSALRAIFPEPDTLFATATSDLNGDGREEVLAYAYGPAVCGSGGCSLVVLTPDGEAYRAVVETSVTQEPVRVLDTSSNGWRDLSVGVSGGGAEGRQVRLQFDGKTYPSNPTVLPDTAVVAQADGTLVITDPLQGATLPPAP